MSFFTLNELASISGLVFDDGIRARYTGPPTAADYYGQGSGGGARTRVTDPVSVLISGPQLLVLSPNPQRREPIMTARWEEIADIKQRTETESSSAAARFALLDGSVLILEATVSGSCVINSVLKGVDFISTARNPTERLANLNSKLEQQPAQQQQNDNKLDSSHHSRGGVNGSTLSSPYTQLREKYNIRSASTDSSDVDRNHNQKRGASQTSSSRYAGENTTDERAIEEIRRKEQRIRDEIADTRRSTSRHGTGSETDEYAAERRRRAAAERARVHRSNSRGSSGGGSTALEVYQAHHPPPAHTSSHHSHTHQDPQGDNDAHHSSLGGMLSATDEQLASNLQRASESDARVKKIRRQIADDRLRLQSLNDAEEAAANSCNQGSPTTSGYSHSQLRNENIKNDIEASMAQLERDSQGALQATEAQRRRTGVERPAAVGLPPVRTSTPATNPVPAPTQTQTSSGLPAAAVAPPAQAKKLVPPPPKPAPPASTVAPAGHGAALLGPESAEERPAPLSRSATDQGTAGAPSEPTELEKIAEAQSPPPTATPNVAPPPPKPSPPTPPAPKTTAPSPPKPAAPVVTPSSSSEGEVKTKYKAFKQQGSGKWYFVEQGGAKSTKWKLPEDAELINPEVMPDELRPASCGGKEETVTTEKSDAEKEEEQKKIETQKKKQLDSVVKQENSGRMQIDRDYKQACSEKTIEINEGRRKVDLIEAERAGEEKKKKDALAAEEKKAKEAEAAQKRADNAAAKQKEEDAQKANAAAAAEEQKRKEAAAEEEKKKEAAAEAKRLFDDPSRPLRKSGDWQELRTKEGKYYFGNKAENKTTWKIEETPFKDMPLTSTAGDSSPAAAASPTTKPKPDSFFERKDGAGKTYFVNALTGKSAWSLPTGAELVTEAEAKALKSAAASPAGSPARATAETKKADDEEGEATTGSNINKYVELKHPKTGKTYYSNVQTKETVWKLPDGAVVVDAASVSKHASPARTGGASLAVGSPTSGGDSVDAPRAANEYFEKQDPSGKTYLVNTLSGKSVWSLPAGAKIVERPTNAGSPARGAAASLLEDAEASPTPTALPKVVYKPKKHANGKTYYINMATGKTTWDRPTDGKILEEEEPKKE